MIVFKCTAMMLLSVSGGCGKMGGDQSFDSEKTALLTVFGENKDKSVSAIDKLENLHLVNQRAKNKILNKKWEIQKQREETSAFYKQKVKKLHDEIQALKRENVKNKYSRWGELKRKQKDYALALATYEQKVKRDQESAKSLVSYYAEKKETKNLLLTEMNNIVEMVKSRMEMHKKTIDRSTALMSDFYHFEIKKMHDQLEDLKSNFRKRDYSRWNEYKNKTKEYQERIAFHSARVKEINQARGELAKSHKWQMVLESKILEIKNK